MRQRPSARLLVVDAAGRLLLFRFEYDSGALADRPFWATPGGALEPGETFAMAARRELFEETGLEGADLGDEVHRREAVIQLPAGDSARVDERFFLVRVDAPSLKTDGWTEDEQRVMVAHRWWTQAELLGAPDQFWPENLAEILQTAGVWPASPQG